MEKEDYPPFRSWLAAWLRDYVFWRDILSTTIGGVLVLVTAYTWAVLMGLLQRPEITEAILSFLKASWPALLVPLVGILIALMFSRRDFMKDDSGSRIDYFGQSLQNSFRARPQSQRDPEESD